MKSNPVDQPRGARTGRGYGRPGADRTAGGGAGSNDYFAVTSEWVMA